MVEIEINILPEASFSKAEQIIEKCCASEGLQMTLKGTLSKYPGCVHWHFKKGAQRGTLEITLWKKVSRIWFSIQAGRTGDWIEESVARLKVAFERKIV